MAVSLETVRTAVELAGNVPAAAREDIARRLHEAVENAPIEGALQRHLRHVSEPTDGRWVATVDSVERALNALDPEPRNRRTAGVILEGNLFARSERQASSESVWPHTVRLGAGLTKGFVAPEDVPDLDTTALSTASSPALSPDRLRLVWSGGPMGSGLPQRNYLGAGYDPDGNVDLVFLAYTFGPALAEGRGCMSTWELRERIDAWIHHLHERASSGQGPRTLVALVEQMASLGRAESLLEDSRVIAESAWLEVLTDDPDWEHTIADVVAFLDGRRFHGISSS